MDEPRLRPFNPDGTINPAALDEFEPVGRISGDDTLRDGSEMMARLVRSRDQVRQALSTVTEAVDATIDPAHRFADIVADINDTLDRVFGPNPDAEQRIHGFAVGDRVQMKHQPDPDNPAYGHVVRVRPGCHVELCRQRGCPLIHVQQFGTEGVWTAHPDWLEHLD